MLCPDCQTEMASSPGADVQICENCRRNSMRSRKVPKLSPGEKKRFRIDNAHHRSGEINNQAPKQDAEFVAFVGSWLETKSTIHMAIFGLLTFLIGQTIHVWAFWVGNYFAWTVANLLTVVGICISVFSIAVTLRNFERRVDSLARLVSRNSATKKSMQKLKGRHSQQS